MIWFDSETLKKFLGTLVTIAEGEQLTTYARYLHSHPDYKAIATKLCIPEGRFQLNADVELWKILRKDLTTLAHTWSVLSYFNIALTLHTSDINVDQARLIYGLVIQMDMDVGSIIAQ